MIVINLNVVGTPTDIPELKVDTTPTIYLATLTDHRATFALPDAAPPHGFSVRWAGQEARSIVPSSPGHYEGGLLQPPLPDLAYALPAPTGLHVRGDAFWQGETPFLWRGSTEFRLPERVLVGANIRPILEDRVNAGANLVRILAMKANNTGYELNPRAPGYWDAVKQTLELCGDAGLYVEWCVFADTKRMMPDAGEQQEFYARTLETVRAFPHVLIELLNEDKHATQAINAQAFSRPAGILASHGSGLSDVQPVKPLWDYGTYHGRRSGGLAKICSNYSSYVFQDTYPLPVPYIPEETLKPEGYGYDVGVASLLGCSARCGAGGTFHHSAWLEQRLWNDPERACATAFFGALQGA